MLGATESVLWLQGVLHRGSWYNTEREAADASFKLYAELHGLPSDAPAPPLLLTSNKPLQYVQRSISGQTPVCEQPNCFVPACNISIICRRLQAPTYAHAKVRYCLLQFCNAAMSSARTCSACMLSSHCIRRETISEGWACSGRSAKPTPPAAPQAAKKTKYPFVFAPRHFGHGYRPMRAYATRLMGGKLVFRPVICKDVSPARAARFTFSLILLACSTCCMSKRRAAIKLVLMVCTREALTAAAPGGASHWRRLQV